MKRRTLAKAEKRVNRFMRLCKKRNERWIGKKFDAEARNATRVFREDSSRRRWNKSSYTALLLVLYAMKDEHFALVMRKSWSELAA